MRTVRQLCTVLAVAAAMLMLAVGTALAQRPPAEPFAPAAPGTLVLPTVTHTTSGGISGWAIALIAIAAAVVGILATEVTHSVLRRRHA